LAGTFFFRTFVKLRFSLASRRNSFTK
jgi:hypothetical protein